MRDPTISRQEAGDALDQVLTVNRRMRVSILGAALTIFPHSALWMACFGGGPLLLAGLWFRKP